MMKKLIKTVIFLSFTTLIVAGCAEKTLKDRVVEYQLDNGMKWFLVKRGYAPVFAGVLQVKVGGADEVEGKSGLAHFMEHLAFKGTKTIGTTDFAAEEKIMEEIDRQAGKGNSAAMDRLLKKQKEHIVSNELWEIFTRNGVKNLNAYTSKDVTTFHSEMPNAKLELWLYLTSEMLSDPTFREFYSERKVVLEEQRTSIDNSPRGRLYKKLIGLAFKNSPYRWPTIGFPEDVGSLQRDDIRAFYDEKYRPECMSGAIVGDIDIKKTKEWIKKYFGKMKPKNTVCDRNVFIDSPQEKLEEATVEFDAEPMMVMGFHKPTVPNYDDYIFDVYAYFLCEGDAARLEKVLVKEKKIAKRVACFNSYPGTRLPNLFVIYAEPFDAETMPILREMILEELERIKNEPITEKEFDRVKNQMKTQFLMGIDNNFELAHLLVYYENVTGSWQYIINHPSNIDEITPDDLMKTARKYFVPENTTYVQLKRKGGGL